MKVNVDNPESHREELVHNLKNGFLAIIHIPKAISNLKLFFEKSEYQVFYSSVSHDKTPEKLCLVRSKDKYAGLRAFSFIKVGEINMLASITKIEIENGLYQLGVKSGMILEVHCSLGSFGHVDGGALTIIDALKNIVGADGAIVMPSFKDSHNLPLSETDKRLGITLKIKLLNGDEERSGMGIVSDTFRKMPDVKTGEGQFRVSAWGKEAEKHAANWFNHLIVSDGYALLLGVDIYKMSSMHYVEDVLPKEIKSLFRPSEEALKIYPESEWFIESWTPPTKPWYTIQKRAYAKGYIADTMIGNSKCMLVEVNNVIGLYKQALQTEPFELYGLM